MFSYNIAYLSFLLLTHAGILLQGPSPSVVPAFSQEVSNFISMYSNTDFHLSEYVCSYVVT